MDTYEATKVVMSRIQTLDPDNASKIMGYILIQDQGEKEMIRLAFGPETLLQSHINQAKACLGIPSNTPSANSSTPLSNPMRPYNPFPQTSPRILIPNNGLHHFSNPSSPASAFQRNSPRPFSYAAAVNASNASGNNNSSSNNSSGSSSLHFYGSNDFGNEFMSRGGVSHNQVQDQLSFLDDSMVDPIMSPSGRSDSLLFPYGEDANSLPSPHSHSHSHPHPFHRRSCSVNDAAFLSNLEEGANGGGFGWRPCMYFAKGFCKNGSSCKFLHSDEGIEMGSPSKHNSGFDELLRLKALQQQQRLALMASGGNHSFGYNKCIDFLNENPRNEFSPMGLISGANSSLRQIYLTFPADSIFKEEDVSNYFSMFGPVQDVRIPYQQKRMFGFVTFVYAETVKLILAKGNPHFVCDSRVLVKPYKEKGKIPDKKQQQCLSPSGIDSRENINDPPFGSRMLLSTQEMMLRRKLEQEAELHAIELQSRRMMNLQLMDLKNQNHNNSNHHFLPSLRGGIPMSSPRQSQILMNNHNFVASSDGINQEDSEEFDGIQETKNSPDHNLLLEGTESSNNIVNGDNSDFPESLENILPDNLFASPTKVASENKSIFSETSASADDSIPVRNTSTNNNTSALPNGSPLSLSSLKSCYIQMPRYSGQEAIEM